MLPGYFYLMRPDDIYHMLLQDFYVVHKSEIFYLYTHLDYLQQVQC